VRQRLLALRWLILDTAAATAGVGRIEEALKWGQPSYLTTNPKSGSTIRIDQVPPGGYALYVHCQTNLSRPSASSTRSSSPMAATAASCSTPSVIRPRRSCATASRWH